MTRRHRLAVAAVLLAAVALPLAAQDYRAQRLDMVERQVRSRQVSDAAVLEAMEKVPRHRFVPSVSMAEAYDDK
ncbi:MAG TPA: protein-L-isoaspartate O-methyltransferase, partial [Thermoanaerobaculia bacterium]|nr:protein-L-isoaspartate O-methyltransferase [Thermoanaerobaculia bacterium]